MIVSIDPEVLDAGDCAAAIDDIFRLFERGRHGWWAPDPTRIRASAWYQDAGPRHRRRIEALLERGEQHLRPTLHVALRPRPGRPWTLAPEPAAVLLRQPVRVLVENADSDGVFIERVLLCVGARELRRRLGPDLADDLCRGWTRGLGFEGWFELVHGGGGTLAARMQAHAASAIRGPLLVVVDSDRGHPDDPPGGTASKAVQAGSDLRIGPDEAQEGWEPVVHVLRQREVENYIPDEALREAFGGRRTAWLVELDAPQRACWDHKNGLRKELEGEKGATPPLDPSAWRWKRENIRSLFASVPPHEPFVHGFGGRTWTALLLPTAEDPAALRRRAGGELDVLANLIFSAL